mgnify:CR=1 FL=1
MIFRAVCTGEGIDAHLLHKFRPEYDLDDLMNTLECKVAQESWSDAAWLNAEQSRS